MKRTRKSEVEPLSGAAGEPSFKHTVTVCPLTSAASLVCLKLNEIGLSCSVTQQCWTGRRNSASSWLKIAEYSAAHVELSDPKWFMLLLVYRWLHTT